MIYLDNAATTKPFKNVLDEFCKISTECFANPSSSHGFAYKASLLIEEAKVDILSTLNLTKTHKIIFTSCATESDNLAIKGIAHQYQNRGKKIISCVSEHAGVLQPLKQLQEEGFEVVLLPLGKDGSVDIESLKKEMNNETILVSLMSVNNETGIYNDYKKISEIVSKFPKCFFHIDATQSMGKDNIDYSKASVISFSSHKFGGLKGIGGLIYKSNIIFKPINQGGGQEFGFRSGTMNTAGIVSTALALKTSYGLMKTKLDNVKFLRNYLEEQLLLTNEVNINSIKTGSPFVLNFSLRHKKASVVVEALSEKEIYVSTVSACSSKGEPVSPTLTAMGKSHDDAANSIRVSLTYETTKEEIDGFLEAFKKIISEVVDR